MQTLINMGIRVGYEIGFDRKGKFSFLGGGYGKNVIIFGVDMSSYFHIDNKRKDILILGIGLTQGLVRKHFNCSKNAFY